MTLTLAIEVQARQLPGRAAAGVDAGGDVVGDQARRTRPRWRGRRCGGEAPGRCRSACRTACAPSRRPAGRPACAAPCRGPALRRAGARRRGPAMICFQARPTSPTTFSSGTKTSVKKTSLTSRPPIVAIPRTSTPSTPVGTSSIVRPPWRDSSRLVRATSRHALGYVRRRAPRLLAVDHVTAVVARRATGDVAHVRTGLRLGDRDRHHLALDHRAEHVLLLLQAAEALVAAGNRSGRAGAIDRRQAAVDLFEEDALVDERAAGTAVLLRGIATPAQPSSDMRSYSCWLWGSQPPSVRTSRCSRVPSSRLQKSRIASAKETCSSVKVISGCRPRLRARWRRRATRRGEWSVRRGRRCA